MLAVCWNACIDDLIHTILCMNYARDFVLCLLLDLSSISRLLREVRGTENTLRNTIDPLQIRLDVPSLIPWRRSLHLRFRVLGFRI